MSNSANDVQEATSQPSPFGGDDVMPFEKQRRAHRFLTQETRYHIVQAILGHPAHLATLDELEYLVPKNRSTIREHLDRLAEKHIIDKYVYDGDAAGQYDPREFWGLTSYGITLLDEYDYLRYVPVLRALQDNLHLTEKIERHRTAPRPPLPETVEQAFRAPDLEADTKEAIDAALTVQQSDSLFDAPPIKHDSDTEAAENADRPIDELF